MRDGSREHGSHVAMLTPRTPLHLGRYGSIMPRAMEEGSLMTRYDDDDLYYCFLNMTNSVYCSYGCDTT